MIVLSLGFGPCRASISMNRTRSMRGPLHSSADRALSAAQTTRTASAYVPPASPAFKRVASFHFSVTQYSRHVKDDISMSSNVVQTASRCGKSRQDHPQKSAPRLLKLQKSAHLKKATNPVTLLQRVATFAAFYLFCWAKGTVSGQRVP